MTHSHAPLTALVLLFGCAPGAPDATDPTGGSTVPPALTTDGTQVGGEGTEPPETCAPEEGLALDTELDDGTLGDALEALAAPVAGPVVWFDEREEALELSATVVDGSARRDSYCHVLVDVEAVVTTPSGDVAVAEVMTLSVRSDYLSGYVDIQGDDWEGGLDEVDVIDEACVLGDNWRLSPRWIDGVPTGTVSVRCDPWSGGGGSDTGMGDTGGTDTSGSTPTATALTGTTTATPLFTDTTTDVDTTGGTGDGEGDPQLGFSVDVVSW